MEMRDRQEVRDSGSKLGPETEAEPELSGDVFYILFSNLSPPATGAPGATLYLVLQDAAELFVRILSELNPPSAYSPCSHTIRDCREEMPKPHYFIPQMETTHGEAH